MGGAAASARRSRRSHHSRRAGGIALAAAALVVLTGCGTGSSGDAHSTPAASVAPEVAHARPLTQHEAEQLAVTRFRNFDAGTRAITATIPVERDGEAFTLTMTGWVDFATHRGYATLSESGASGAMTELGLLLWSTENLAIRMTPADTAPLPVPTDGWSSQPLKAEDSALSTALLLALNLGSDRPENPQLLMQSDAAWIGTGAVNGVDTTVFVGPSATPSDEAGALPAGHGLDARSRYHVDKTGVLLRFDTRIGDSEQWSHFEFANADGVVLDLADAVPEAPALPSAPPSAG